MTERNKVDPAFAEWFGLILKANNLTQKQVREALNLHRNTLHLILTSKRGVSPEMVEKLCRVINDLAGKDVANPKEGVRLVAPRHPKRAPATKPLAHFSNNDEFAVYLLKVLDENKIRIPALAEESGLPHSTISRFLHGQQQMRMSNRLKLSKALLRLVEIVKAERYYEKAKPESSAK